MCLHSVFKLPENCIVAVKEATGGCSSNTLCLSPARAKDPYSRDSEGAEAERADL